MKVEESLANLPKEKRVSVVKLLKKLTYSFDNGTAVWATRLLAGALKYKSQYLALKHDLFYKAVLEGDWETASIYANKSNYEALKVYKQPKENGPLGPFNYTPLKKNENGDYEEEV